MAGGVVLTFAWMGMAELAYVDGQMPYLVSGGAAGIALVIVGSTLVLSAAMFDAAERGAQRTAELLKQAADEASEEQERTAEAAEAQEQVDARERSAEADAKSGATAA
jgi:hypothetical protein